MRRHAESQSVPEELILELFSAATAETNAIHLCGYKPVDIEESNESSNGGEANYSDSVYHELLRKFPDITKPYCLDQEIKHLTVHYVEITRRPATAKLLIISAFQKQNFSI
ncbi:hypothetical protein TNCT_404471 [Trichonephila clavata]|uniref:Uncharacterized protein n=1 Tax=Trichonephila clavata TaxID=2740835 RepID=A0A8X6LN63_TRICU|nr:hypothetical protein TNCT_404471 [Trichonephila clavata]